ncbi:MAG: hypothetical protein OQK46_03975 [Gammaproteobacteria bacterium]|nr:hypothetical protein [Gammaproteobacteria bacterium]
MTKLRAPKKITLRNSRLVLLASLISIFVFTPMVSAEGVFEDKKKEKHELSGANLNRIKAEHQLKFGRSTNVSSSYKSNNPWDKKKKKASSPVNKASWGECREYALHKRNRCYREGRDAYRCEQMYEARSGLCDKEL